ncbi:hypothetical protein [Salinicola endophyticus]|uniref:hypothetical protein n=1 Tax=Salinicola endophyticus TaxID=1949083 RepID=UPI001300A962|nr:hypothetical protein [Salinicola endophyticus]
MTSQSPVNRSPNGCRCQVMTQLTPAERDRFKALATAEGRSLSATVRLLALRGLAQQVASEAPVSPLAPIMTTTPNTSATSITSATPITSITSITSITNPDDAR